MKTKPRPRRTSKPRVRQLDLFDAKPVPAVKAGWKQPKHDKASDPTWFHTWQPPETEDLDLRRKVFGY